MVNTQPTTVRELAQSFGIITDGSPNWALRTEVTALLRVLLNDIAADQDISDTHPRFWEHSVALAVWAGMAPENQDKVNGICWADGVAANREERQAIADLQARFLS